MEKWFILDREGNPMPDSELPERPSEAQPTEGDNFRPWFKQEEHIHIESGRIVGIHGSGTLESVQKRLEQYLVRENDLLQHFGGKEDILVSQANSFLDSMDS